MTSTATATDPAESEDGPAGRRLFGALRDRIAAADPAFSRLRLASRAMLSVLLAAILLGLVTLIRPLPIAAYGTSIVVAFLGSMAINDATAKAQAVSRAYALVVTVAAVLLASLLVGQPIVADIVFLVVAFGAVYVRKFGQRWFGLGMLAFMAYFMGDYMRPAPADIGWIGLAAALTLAVTHVVTNVLLRKDPERDFRRALVTIDRRINLILRDLRQPAADARKRMARHMGQLRDIVLMAEGFLPQGAEGSLAAEGAASDLAIALFDLQLAVERLVRLAATAPMDSTLLDAALRRDLRRLNRIAKKSEADEEAARPLILLEKARQRLQTTLGPAPSPAFIKPADAGTKAPGGGAKPDEPKGLVPVALQLPIQVTLACAIAMGIGLMLSPVRWYWAVITAFIVFNNTRSRADTLVRALQRSGGTLLGIFAGTGIALLLQGQMIVSGIAIPVLFFFAFYFLATSYSLMILLITIALALLYGLMGMFTPELMVLRLEETIAGGLAGALVAFLVFPARASTAVASALEKYLTALQELVEAARSRAKGEDGARDLMVLSRALDRAYVDMATAVRPLGGPWNAVTRFGSVREKLLLLSGGAHWGRVLAQNLSAQRKLSGESVTRIETVADEIKHQIADMQKGRQTFFNRPRLTGHSATSSRHIPAAAAETSDPAAALEAIATLLDHALVSAGSRSEDGSEELERVKGIEPSS